jgi:voltage-gated potassium channel
MRRTSSGPRRLGDLSRAERRRAGALMVLRCAYSLTVIVGLYYVLPLRGDALDGTAILRLVIGVLLFVVVLRNQLRRISHADLPELRAVESVVVVVALFLCVYASVYVTLSRIRPSSFSEHLDRTGGLYFVITTFGTVGFGDIFPKTDLARLLVSSQILLDLVFIAVIVRLLFGVSRRTLGQRTAPASGHEVDATE